MNKLTHIQAERLLIDQSPIRYRKTAHVLAIQLQEDFEIETREGSLTAHKGDYLVANSSPEISYPWPVKKEIFEATYQEL